MLAGARPAAEEEHSHPDPPYLKLKQFIEPGNDEFTGEKEAQALKAKLHAALASKTLANAAIGPTAYKQIAPDLAEATFEGAPHELARVGCIVGTCTARRISSHCPATLFVLK